MLMFTNKWTSALILNVDKLLALEKSHYMVPVIWQIHAGEFILSMEIVNGFFRLDNLISAYVQGGDSF